MSVDIREEALPAPWLRMAHDRNPERQRGGLPLLPEDGLHPGRHRPVRLSGAAGRGAVAVVEGAGRGLLGARKLSASRGGCYCLVFSVTAAGWPVSPRRRPDDEGRG